MPPLPLRAAVAALLLATGSCDSAGSPTGLDPATCLPGWWYDVGKAADCLGGCGGGGLGSSNLPECLAVDCTDWTITAYLTGGAYYSGVILYSAKAGTTSTNGTLSAGVYMLNAQTLAVSTSAYHPQNIDYCDQQQLIIDGRTYNRLDRTVAAALLRAVSSTPPKLAFKELPVR